MPRKKSVGLNLTTTDKVAIYTVPKGLTGYWEVLHITNTGSTNSINVFWYDKSTNTEYYVIGGKNLSTGEILQFVEGTLVLEHDDEIRLQLGSAGTMSAIVTVQLETHIGINGGS